MSLRQSLDDYCNRLGNGFEALPSWGQTICVLSLLACLGAIGGHVWLMPVGEFVQAILVLFIAWLVLSRWRWGFLCFVIVAGGIWFAVAEHRIAAAMVVVAVTTLTVILVVLPKSDAPRHDQA